MAACIDDASRLDIIDTVIEEDRPRLEEFLKLETGRTYSGYFYDRSHIWIKIHDGDTNQVIHEEEFRGNGKAMQYLLQVPHIKPDDLTLDGPKGQLPRRHGLDGDRRTDLCCLT